MRPPIWTKEFMDNWVKDRQSGSQGTFDKLTYEQPEDKSYATFHWLWVLGLPGGEKNNFKRSRVRT